MPNFQLFEKGDVNGEKEQKFYTFLKVRVHNLEEAASSCSAQPMGMFWHWFSSLIRGLGRPIVPSPCCRDKTGPTGASEGPTTFQSAEKWTVKCSCSQTGPFPQCQAVFSLEGRGGQKEPQVRLMPLSPLLQNSCPPTAELLGSPGRLFWEPMKIHDIRWNFEKFLVGPDGIPIMRWYHRTTVSNVKMDILSYMRRQAALNTRGK